MKKGLKSLSVVLLSVLGMVGCAGNNESGKGSEVNPTSSFKAGFILIGDESEGYSEAHINGINAAKKALNLTDSQILMKKKVEENDDAKNAAEDLVASGCNLIISNSYGHQSFMAEVAQEYPDVQFVSATGDFASISGINNFSNAFTNIYEARYVSGIVGGMKLKELFDSNKLTDANKDGENYKIGYVGAYTYAEVISGYTAFYLGVKSVVSNVTMSVEFTDSWFDIDKEGAAAENLVNQGCVIIGQHADSTGAPSKCETLLNNGKTCYSVGYNVDMLSVAPHAALTSSTNNWEVYYEYAMKTAMEGKKIKTDWSEGYKSSAVGITKLGTSAASGTAEAVAAAEKQMKEGTFHVFDTTKFTVNNQKLTSHKHDFSFMDFTTNPATVVYKGENLETVRTEGNASYVEESVVRSAPYFDIHIDGINWTNKTK